MTGKLRFSIICLFLCASGLFTAHAQSARILNSDGILSSSSINDVLQSRDGSLWIATDNGVNCYDGVRVKVYKHQSGNVRTLADNLARKIIEDRDGNIIVGTQFGVQIYDPLTDTFGPALSFSDGGLHYGNVNEIVQRGNGDIWISGNDLAKVVIDGPDGPCLERLNVSIPTVLTEYMIEDVKGRMWVSKFNDGVYRLNGDGSSRHYFFPERWANATTFGLDSRGVLYAGVRELGLARFDEARDEFEMMDIEEFKGTAIMCIYDLQDGTLCIGTDEKGAFLFNPATGEVSRLEMNDIPFDPAKLSIHSAMKDNQGNIWLGAYRKGLIMLPVKRNNFRYIGSKAQVSDLIGSGCVTSLLTDNNNLLWVGTDNDGIYIVTPDKRRFAHISVENGAPFKIMGLVQGPDGRIWFGSSNEGLWSANAGSYTLTKHPHPNLGMSVQSIAIDNRGLVWMATLGDGIQCYNSITGRWIDTQETNEAVNAWTNDVLIMSNGNLAVATYNGINILNISNPDNIESVNHSLIGRIAYSLLELDGKLYAGTTNSIFIVDLENDLTTTRYTVEDGLPDGSVNDMRADDLGKIWLSTNSGLASFYPETGYVARFYSGDGLQGNEFSLNASTKGQNGMLFFGGTGGITCFFPSDIVESQPAWNARITAVTLPDGTVIQPDSDNVYSLKYNTRTCIIEFATAEYNASDGTTFSYSIDSGPWNSVSRGSSNITMNNLNPGQYAISIRAESNGVKSQPTSIVIKVNHPWWGTTFMKLLYILLGLAVIGIIGCQKIKEFRDKEEIKRHIQAEELNASKLQFFLNLSHEIRSPLTLIEGPLNRLRESDSDPERQYQYQQIYNSSRRILNLVNQMLDINKIENGQMKMHFAATPMVGLVSGVCDLFRDIASQRNVKIDFRYSGSKEMEAWVDPAQFDKIIVNLLSNAVKFSPEDSRITVTLSNDGNNARIDVKDEGPGMDQKDLEKVFERFYQAGNQAGGTGIGLNLSRMLAQLHHGTIKAANNPDGPGSTFTVTIPLGNAHLSSDEIDSSPAATDVKETGIFVPGIASAPQASSEKTVVRHRKTVLLVEDDLSIRQYVAHELSRDFYISECSNGKQALDIILRDNPDLVISDIMMPEMDGYTLCKKIRKNININSTPVILLTAKAGEEEEIAGLETGADAYITKPFNIEVLRKTALNLISGRELLKVSYSDKQVETEKIETEPLSTPDERLLDRVMKVISANLDNPKLTVEMVADEVGISRVHLHRKLKELTNQTSRDFIRNVRLRKAAEMLTEKKYAISELSEVVGFSSPASFATAFKNLYGVSPSEYVQGRQNEQK